MTKKLLSVLLILVLSMGIFTGCGSKVDEFVTVSNVNQSGVNVAEGFFQAIFTNDIDLFEACFPDSFKSFEGEDGDTVNMQEVLDQYASYIDPTYTYAGASLSGYNDYNEEYGYTDFDSLAEDIAAIHHTTPDMIAQAQIVKLRLNFDTDDGSRLTNDVYILVYKTDMAWYVFELQNSDAEFAV